MSRLSKLLRNVILVFFIIFQYYCSAQTEYKKDQLLTTWKLQSMTYSDGIPYVKIEELPNELITFKCDSIWERNRGKDKLEGIWYHYGPDMLIIQSTRHNGIQIDLRGGKSYWKIKELTSSILVLIYQEREGNDITYTYSSYIGK